MISSQINEKSCPVCQTNNRKIIDSKLFGLTRLVECQNCKLRFRLPKDKEDFVKSFYQKNYKENDITELPNDKELEVLLNSNFKTKRNIQFMVPILKSISDYLGRKISIFDYGASWGYYAYQLQSLEFVKEVKCFEISKKTRIFGEKKLGITYVDKLTDDVKVDLFFSSHVIEHIPNPLILKKWADKFLKDDGIIFIICPNGSEQAKINKNWSITWGEKHPNFISDEFLEKNFSNYKGTIFEKELFKNDLDKKLSPKNIHSLLPTSLELWFVAQKKQIS